MSFQCHYKSCNVGLVVYLIFVGGVEGDLSNLGVFFSHATDRSAAQLNTLQQGSFRGITSYISL